MSNAVSDPKLIDDCLQWQKLANDVTAWNAAQTIHYRGGQKIIQTLIGPGLVDVRPDDIPPYLGKRYVAADHRYIYPFDIEQSIKD